MKILIYSGNTVRLLFTNDSYSRDSGYSNVQPEIEAGAARHTTDLPDHRVVVRETPRLRLLNRQGQG